MPQIVVLGDKRGCAILAAGNNLAQDGFLPDVTLNTDGHELHLHQIVLAAFSPFFRRILQNLTVPHPVLMLDVPYADLLVIVEAIYHGSAKVPIEQLRSVMRTADTLMMRDIRPVPDSPAAVSFPAAAAIEVDDPQPGPSGQGRPRVRFASPVAEVAQMLYASTLEEESMEVDEPEDDDLSDY